MLKQNRQQYQVIKSQSKSLEKKANDLLNGKRRKTRRGQKKKPAWILKRKKEQQKAMIEYRKAKRELAKHWKEANRLMETE